MLVRERKCAGQSVSFKVKQFRTELCRFLTPLDDFRVDFDKDCEDPEYKPLQGPPKDQDDEVRNSHLSPAFLCY